MRVSPQIGQYHQVVYVGKEELSAPLAAQRRHHVAPVRLLQLFIFNGEALDPIELLIVVDIGDHGQGKTRPLHLAFNAVTHAVHGVQHLLGNVIHQALAPFTSNSV